MHKSKRIKQILIQIIILFAGIVVMQGLLHGMSSISNLKQQKSDNETELNLMVDKIKLAEATKKDNLASFDASAAAKGKVIAYYLDHHINGQRELGGLSDEWRLKGYALLDANGNVMEMNGFNLAMEQEDIAALITNLRPVTVDNSRYYAVRLNQGRTLLYCRSFTTELNQLESYYSISAILGSLSADSSNLVTAVDLDSQTILYSKFNNLIGNDAVGAGFDLSVIQDGYNGTSFINGEKMYVSAKRNENVLLITAENYQDVVSRNRMTIELIQAVYVIVISLLIIYSDFIRQDLAAHPEKPMERRKLPFGLYYDSNIGKKIRAVIVIGMVAILTITFYLETLGPLSRQGTLSEGWLTSVETILNRDKTESDKLKKEFNSDYVLLAQHLAYTLRLDPNMINHDTLMNLADTAGISAIYVFNEEGDAVGISEKNRAFHLNTDPESQSYPFWSVVNGTSLIYVQDAKYDELGEYMQYIGVQRQDANGMVQIGVDPSKLERRMVTTGLQSTLTGTSVGEEGFLFAVNAETGEISADHDTDMIGRKASVIGLSAPALSDDYSGFQTIEETPCFVSSSLYNNSDYVYVAFPLSVIYSQRVPGAIAVTLLSFIIIMIIYLLMTISKNPTASGMNPDSDEEKSLKDSTAFFRQSRLTGIQQMTQSAVSRYGENIPWSVRTPEQKLSSVTSVFLILTAACLALYLEAFRTQAMDNYIISYIMGQKWEQGLNLFSVTYCVFIMTEVIIFSWLLRFIIVYFLSRFGSRSETLGHLLNSFLKYAAVIGGIFYCLNSFGLDAATLITSAGILTLVIGFGAQSLISDILAGISIVFEGAFRVGDIVTIDGWRGEVVEIGIRTTKIRSVINDIRIFNNSTIASVVNMTKQYSYAIVDVGVDYNESLEHVETVLKEELPLIHERIPAIVAGPYYKGVTELAESSVNLRIMAECSEQDRIQVTRDLNREIFLIFKKYNVNIPFPQVVLNYRDEEPDAEATAGEKEAAARFIRQQREKSGKV